MHGALSAFSKQRVISRRERHHRPMSTLARAWSSARQRAWSVNIRCTGVGGLDTSGIGVLRNEVWEDSGEVRRGCTAACRRELAELRREVLEERRQARYYRRMHGKAVEREQRLKSELQAARAKLELRQRLRERWARRRGSEKRTRSLRQPRRRPAPRRGQQRGAPGHGRRQHAHLPVQVEAHPERRRCPACGDRACSWRSMPTGG